ncbi:Holliday junction resolvase RuvX [bacterium (Candidatus Blackallbacteria) CG17_big_fil_post_rev_8_21_14_2_50_48_46]|uniref:Putative pre-16S rRNA nuclease n=1 Tax=bacterium (Candidatus Blackallbacteria) CG17_big_fil_post_rev_8_21_14_2_50_48_46 TaxID=2014261 RepID=A0A2M7FZ79_9BACT|nr:MAG: Holliday junction resolvase RuvX [bacterium (Candidatus Blackallbacteria) CG18_big_fil_WC_8_21_14_2_50_49_26]PIW14707.1 MAG: Holliday junction resolvase RuvX [bacterium (Candidatus Blackallbacteria) CG17_big_fil_post_rev_8_21_14_2_50_48_46]PIW50809.1 MAG: Holliday junction resolvase RuvX [bacterium (Candidatus Blackallbacteria) CG13_big_fil_rev_8_21_14_2_50_49_14]
MQPKPRVLGLDVGTRTIGIAVSDPMGWFARPVTTIQRKSWKDDLAELAKILQEFQAKQIVVGLPLGGNGEMTEQARYSKGAANRIHQEFPDLELHFIDESHSSEFAQEQMLATGMKKRKRKAMIDQVAAVKILQDFIDQEALREKANAARQKQITTNEITGIEA